MKRMGSGSGRRGGRPFGENTNSGKGLMTAYTRPFGSTMSMRVSGKKETSVGRSLLVGMVKRTRGAWGPTSV